MGLDDIEPIALERFLHDSRAQGRALNAIHWLCNNLQVGWPFTEVEKPDTKKPSHIGMESKQATTAQPGMLKALSRAMERQAEDDVPIWLALLGSWLQSHGNQRLIHVLNRSVPVEKNEEWMVFFCKRGKQKHNRSGFYWGAPTKTSSGYDWSIKFLEAYDKRRHSEFGKKLMGIVFRTDTQQCLASKTVNVLTANVISKPRIAVYIQLEANAPNSSPSPQVLKGGADGLG